MIDNISHAHALTEASGLTPEAIKLVREDLPFELYPRNTIDQYARIINQTAQVWEDPPAFRKYYDELLNDERGGRQGFPFEVLMELTNIKQEFDRRHPGEQSVFDMQFDQFLKRM